MHKLSILIAAHDEAQLETSLISILQNRPRDCEIVVVHDGGYQDPYDLAEEVRFLPTPALQDAAARLNVGVAECRAPVIHVLGCGAEVTDGWTNAAVAHFKDASVASVAPLVVSSDGAHVAAAGLEYRCGGRRVASKAGAPVTELAEDPQSTLGPTLAGAFYRRSALAAWSQPFSSVVGDRLTDVDLALRLARRGHRAMFEPASRIVAPQPMAAGNALSEGWLAERLFWRHADAMGVWKSCAAHLGLVMGEALGTIVKPWQAPRFVGRLTGSIERVFCGRRIKADCQAAADDDSAEEPICLPLNTMVRREQARRAA